MFCAALNKKLKLRICARQEKKIKRTPEALSYEAQVNNEITSVSIPLVLNLTANYSIQM